ncbi:unnamed protein product [Parajaminaea phylloscopi]
MASSSPPSDGHQRQGRPDEVATELHHEDSAPDPEMPPSRRRSVADLQEEVYELFEQLVDDGDADVTIEAHATAQSIAPDPARARTILCKDLPRLLGEFERKRGNALVDDDSRGQLEQFCQQIPDQPIACDDLVNMIVNLESALTQGTEASISGPATSGSEQGTTTDEDGASSDASSDRGPGSAAALSPQNSSPALRPRPFPRSQSDSLDLHLDQQRHSSDASAGTIDRPKRTSLSSLDSRPHRTSSASAIEPQSEQSVRRARRRSQLDAAVSSTSGNGEDRDIFRGKGRAPPSSWQRPRPQALAARSRRTSEVSRDSDTIDEAEEEDTGRRRQRQVSQPLEQAEHSPGQMPTRSVSSGYIFPRATSPGHSEDRWYAEQEERWEKMSADRADRPRSNTSRAGSPELESPGFQPFGVLGSPATPNSPRFRQTGPSTSLRSIYDASAADNEELGALQRRYDNLVRTLQDKERTFESTQSIHETTIVELEAKVEQLQERLHGLSRTNDEMKSKEQRYLDDISRLESDLANSQRRGDNAERIKELMHQDLGFREASINSLQGKVTELQERIGAAEREEAEHFGRQQEWEQDREQYRAQLEDVRSQLQSVLDKEAAMEELEREREALQAQLREAHVELEEARRGSGFLPSGRGPESKPATLSQKAGTSLGSELRGIWERGDEGEQSVVEADESNNDTEHDADASLESVVVTTTRRRRQGGGVKAFQEGSAQTDGADVGPSDLNPPSYDEAATEKAVTSRIHPPAAQAEEAGHYSVMVQHGLLGVLGVGAADVSSPARQYSALSRQLGTRCTVLEGALSRYSEVQGTVAHDPTRRRSPTARVMESAASRILPHLPGWAREGLGARAKARREDHSFNPSPSSRILMAGSGVLVIGIFIGHLLAPGNTHYHYHGGSLVSEDSLAWHLSNSLNLGLGGSHIEYASDPYGPGQSLLSGLFGRWLTRSARQLAGVPL